MKSLTEFLYRALSSLPPNIRDRGLALRLRNRFRHWEILRRTRPLVENPAYKEMIEERRFKVIFVSPIFKSFPLLAVSLKEQSYENWELLFVHDGPSADLDSLSRAVIESDARITFMETDERANDWGHTPRQAGFKKIAEDCRGDFLVISNSDNYHVPGYIEKMLERFDDATSAVYCDMVHDYYSWRRFETRLEYSFIDCGCVMARLDTALSAGWNDNSYEGDWRYVSDLIDQCGLQGFKKVEAPLFVHS